MCGISGFVDFKSNSNETILKNMTRTMEHRGPDGEGYFFKQENNYSVGLGHKRLSIIDLSSAGTQPMHYLHYSILLNGEIYNYAEIKDVLTQLGHQFVSNSDTEVVLHAFMEWGKDCVHRFIGMFAIIIYDAQQHQLICIRDRAGVKPFYYYWHNGLFLFTSELKAFHQHPQFAKEINHNAVARYLQYGNVPAPHCIFNNCHKLIQGHSLVIDLSTQQITTQKYWSVDTLYNKPKLAISFDEAKQETEKILSKAFDYRMIADVPVGVFLSGGYDSSAVAALLQNGRTNSIKTFTIGMGKGELDEAPFAKKVAKVLGTQHNEYYCTEQDALDLIPKLPFYYDEPFGDSSAIPTMLVSKMAKQQVTVALSADAGDEVFAGYNRYDYAARYLKRLKQIPSPLRALAATAMEVLPVRQLSKDPLIAQRFRKIKEIIKHPQIEHTLQILTAEFYDNEICNLMKPPIKHLPTLHSSTNIDRSINSEIEYMMAMDFNTYMCDDVLQKVDRATMAFSLEGREPFLDQHIIEFAAQLPLEFKYNEKGKKYILKEIVHQYIPKDLMDRPKAGFAIPITDWLSKDLNALLMEKLSVTQINKYGLLKPESVQEMLTKFNSGKIEYTNKLWYILILQLWCEEWM